MDDCQFSKIYGRGVGKEVTSEEANIKWQDNCLICRQFLEGASTCSHRRRKPFLPLQTTVHVHAVLTSYLVFFVTVVVCLSSHLRLLEEIRGVSFTPMYRAKSTQSAKAT